MKHGLNKITGLSDLKQIAKRDIVASFRLKERFPHTGLFGPGGLGKTYFTEAIAEELGYHFFCIEGSTVSTKKELVRLLITADELSKQHQRRLLFFIDECHRLGKLQEVLYYPITEWYIITDDGKQTLNPFTLFTATTHPHMLLSSFVSRLSNIWYFQPYSVYEIQRMIYAKFSSWNIDIAPHISLLVAKRCLGIPRLANNLCYKIRNEVIYRGHNYVTIEDCIRTFEIEGIDYLGLRREHREYLIHLCSSKDPCGIKAIAGKIGLDPDVVEGNIEPVLLEKGFIEIGSRGRILTDKGKEYLSAIK